MRAFPILTEVVTVVTVLVTMVTILASSLRRWRREGWLCLVVVVSPTFSYQPSERKEGEGRC